MQNAVAFANNDVITIAWSYGTRPDGCMGFAVYRIDDKGQEKPLPSHAVFKGYKIKPGQTTAEFPLQKFYWKDPYARLVAEKTGNRRFRYKVVPLQGKPGKLVPMTNLPHIVSNEVEISSSVGPGVEAVFNRGLISTQRVSRAFKGKPSSASLLEQTPFLPLHAPEPGLVDKSGISSPCPPPVSRRSVVVPGPRGEILSPKKPYAENRKRQEDTP